MALSPKQQRFVEEYLVDLNASRAYRAAGYRGSENVCSVEGHKLLRNPKVAAAVTAAKNERSARTEITADHVLQELAKIGFSDIRRHFTEDGGLRRVESLDDHSAACLSSVEVITRRVAGSDRDDPEYENVSKIKLWDKRAALVDIGKHLGMFKERVEHSGPDGGPIEVRDMTEISDEQLAAIAALDQGRA
jgi:phage terminase small subunit